MLRDAVVVSLKRTWPGVMTAQVTVDQAPEGATVFPPGETLGALAYTEVVGPLRVGARVRVEVSPLARRLGTGGNALVTAVISELPEDVPVPHNGHIVKARYTPTQVMVSAVEEQDSPHHAVMEQATSLEGMPVIACDLHSQLPAAIAGIRMVKPDARVVYVLTDGAALPAAFSMAAARLLEVGWISDVVSCGQSFGGTLEAVSIPSGLLAARHVAEADVVVAAQGPGNAGTGTPFGFSGVDVAWALSSAAALGGAPIAALRISAADARERHRGISHHTTAAVGTLTPVPVAVPVPDLSGGSAIERDLARDVPDLAEQADQMAGSRHRVESVDTHGLADALEGCPVALRTMGRSLAEDAGPFLGAGAAGIYAAGLIGSPR